MPEDMLLRGESEDLGAAKANGHGSVSPRLLQPEQSLTFQLHPSENIVGLIARMAKALDGVTVLDWLVFAPNRSVRIIHEAIQRVFGIPEWPITWVDGDACDRQPLDRL